MQCDVCKVSIEAKGLAKTAVPESGKQCSTFNTKLNFIETRPFLVLSVSSFSTSLFFFLSLSLSVCLSVSLSLTMVRKVKKEVLEIKY